MNPVLCQIQRRHDWTPAYRTVFKKPVPQARNSFKVPQTTGKPGWLVFTYDNNTPVCMWITSQECYKVPCCVDERVCNDTFLRVEKVSKTEFVVADMWMYNSNCVFACSSFQQRHEWLSGWLKTFVFETPATIKLRHKSEYTGPVRGYEIYLDDIGKSGFFEEGTGQKVVVAKLPMPDCYEIRGRNAYLRVPDMKTSRLLKTLGDVFEAVCEDNGDGSYNFVRS